ncbi:MAG: hypothetical protein IKZ88_08050 [Neisseriaceae bacterium]|nr:hypothetical protein [Neisseriaceae bacterium]
MNYESVDKAEFSLANVLDTVSHKKYTDFELNYCADGSYWVSKIDEHIGFSDVERLPDNIDAEKWFEEAFSGNLTQDVKALWDKPTFTQSPLNVAYNAIERELKWIESNESMMSEPHQQHFMDLLKDGLVAIKQSILRNIQAA